MLLTLTSLAAAATWTADDTTSLQEAVDSASAGDTVRIDVDLYGPDSESQVWVDKNITIESSDSSDKALIPPMLVTQATVQLNRLELSGQTPDLGGFIDDSNGEVVLCPSCGLMVYDNALVTATGLEATAFSGETAVRVVNAKAELGDVWIETAATPISVEASTGSTQLSLNGCAISANTEPVTVTGSTSSSVSVSVEIDSCSFKNNASAGGPADLLLSRVDYLIVNDTDFEGSSSNNSAGSIEIYDIGDADLDNNSWSGVEGQRGAVYISSSVDEASMPRVDLTNLDFLGNTQSGGLEVEGPVRLVASDLKFEGNSGDNGGAVRISEAQLECSGCRFLGNSSNNSGGAISAEDATLDIENSWFCGNSSDVGAGILYASGGSNSMSHTVLMDQSGQLGSIKVDADGGLDLINVTWTGVEGYALTGNLGDLRLWNSVVMGFQVGLAPAVVKSSSAIDFNLWHELDEYSTNSSLQPGPEALYEDPLFVPRFDADSCTWLPWPRAISPVYDSYDPNHADFRGAIGADISFPWEEPPEEGDSADSDPWVPESPPDSWLDSPTDSPSDSPGLDSEPPVNEVLTWVSGGSGGGGVPAALLLVGAGLALLSRRR